MSSSAYIPSINDGGILLNHGTEIIALCVKIPVGNRYEISISFEKTVFSKKNVSQDSFPFQRTEMFVFDNETGEDITRSAFMQLYTPCVSAPCSFDASAENIAWAIAELRKQYNLNK